MTYPEHFAHFNAIAAGDGPVPTREMPPEDTEPMRRDWEEEEPTKELPAMTDAELLQEWCERQEVFQRYSGAAMVVSRVIHEYAEAKGRE